MPQTQLEQDQILIDGIEEADGSLNTKEADFIESCVRRLDYEGHPLSEKQRKWAQDIAEKLG